MTAALQQTSTDERHLYSLNRAVAEAIGLDAAMAADMFGLGCPDFLDRFSPSTVGLHGDPIIEREKIGTFWIEDERQWRAGMDMHGYTPEFNIAQEHGPTRLIAAMMAFVAAQSPKSSGEQNEQR